MSEPMFRVLSAALLFVAALSGSAVISLPAAISLPPARPTSRFTVTCDSAPSLTCRFASTSLGNPVRYVWSWGDGRREAHSYGTATNGWAAPGSYIVKLTVTDSIGGVSYSTQTVTVPVAAIHDTVRITIHDTLPALHDTIQIPARVDTVYVPLSTASGLALWPRVYLRSTMPTSTGLVIPVAAGGNLQAAIDAANPGDVITLANNGVYAGPITLRTKQGAGWIVIRPQNMTVIPPEGTRLSPTTAGPLPHLVATSNAGAIITDPGAHNYRLIGLDVSIPATITTTGLVRLGNGTETTQVDLPHDLVLDRMYVHGTPTGSVRRCVILNSASSAVLDSYLTDCHDNNGDSQAIAGWNGSGPFLIRNNHLEASGEVIMFGGSEPFIPNLVPSDIDIRGNHISSNIAWKGVWSLKNLTELKSASRVLIEGNVYENAWTGAQTGGAINFKSASAGGAPWQGTSDVNFRLNVLRNVRSVFTVENIPEAVGAPRTATTSRITIDNVLAYDVGLNPGDKGIGVFIVGTPADVTVRHVTVLAPNSALMLDGKITRLRVSDSVFGGSLYPIKGDGVQQGSATLDAFAPGWAMLGNVLVVGDQSSVKNYPIRNTYPATDAGIGFVDAAAKDYRLSSTRALLAKASDGHDPGANIGSVLAATANVVQP